mmetsp:Transcript_42660/g.134537  ORF Transcript_42660/g.134537 Transcript_42660/m.134537 type:complete len:1243 (+) Transcript_42660:2064-5792(+)
MLEELAAISINEVSSQHLALTKRHLSSRTISHVFPSIGLDGQLRLRTVTAAGERLLFICSAPAGAGHSGGAASSGAGGAGPGAAAGKELRCLHGFWLKQAGEPRPGGAASLSMWPQGGGAFALGGQLVAASAGPPRNACLQEASVREPCVYASGVWLAATQRPGSTGTEVEVTARVDSCPSAVASGGSRNLFTSVALDSPVFDLAEEGAALAAVGVGAGACAGQADGDFRTTRSFAVLLRGSVQVYRLSFKTQSLSRPPTTAAECCAHFAQMALPIGAAPSQAPAPIVEGGRLWSWSFDDAGVPSFEEQRRQLESGRPLPPAAHLGRWFCGLLRFLAVVLRPVWDAPLVAPVQRRCASDATRGDGRCLALSEDAVRQLLARLRPALRFARQQGLASAHLGSGTSRGVGGSGVPSGAAARALRYTSERHSKDEGLAQIQQLLSRVLDVAERAQQVFGLLSVLHAQRSAFRILQSAVVAGPSLDALLTRPLGTLVGSAEALGPVVQLCAAVVVESGLTTPAAEVVFSTRSGVRTSGSSGTGRRPLRGAGASTSASSGGAEGFVASGEVCRELEEMCPGIFAQVDLSYVQARLGPAVNQGPGPAGELLRRYATCVSPSSLGDHWVELARSLQNMAGEDPRKAAEVCAEKLEQLQQLRFAAAPSEEDLTLATERAKLLLEALLGALGSDPKVRFPGGGGAAAPMPARALVEQLLRKTAALRFSGQDSADASPARGTEEGVNFVHGVILDHLLGSSQQHHILEELLDGNATDMEGFLRSRCATNPLAGEMLWKHCLRRGRPLDASAILLRLAERSDKEVGLLQRVHSLDLARQVASRALPRSKDLVEQLSAKLDIAIRVQVPLHHELQLLAADERVTARWRNAAEQRREDLQKLMNLQELYQTATDFSLYHIVLVIADTSSSVQEKEVRTSAWITIFFPPAASPYSSSELGHAPAAWQHGLFPLLMLRRCPSFLSRDACASPTPVLTAVSQDELQQRTTRLLSEMATALRDSSAMWDVRCIATLLEYCNCLWFQSVGSAALAGDGAESQASAHASLPTASGEAEEGRPRSTTDPQRAARSWVALTVLLQRPFHFTLGDVVKFYAAMLEQLPSWLKDLQSMLPADPSRRRPALSEDDVYVHLGEVVLAVLDQWVTQVEGGRADERSVEDFANAWPSVEGVLSRLRSRLLEVEGEAVRVVAQRLLKDLRRSEAAGRRLSARCVPPPRAPPPALPVLPPPVPVPALPELA